MIEPRLPKFANEAEEARWWYDNREQVGDDLVKTIREGRTGPGALARLRARQREAEASTTEVATR